MKCFRTCIYEIQWVAQIPVFSDVEIVSECIVQPGKRQDAVMDDADVLDKAIEHVYTPHTLRYK